MDFLPDSFVLDTEKLPSGKDNQQIQLDLKINDEESSVQVKQTIDIRLNYATSIQALPLPELTIYSKYSGRLTYSKKYTTGNALQFNIDHKPPEGQEETVKFSSKLHFQQEITVEYIDTSLPEGKQNVDETKYEVLSFRKEFCLGSLDLSTDQDIIKRVDLYQCFKSDYRHIICIVKE